MVIYRLLFFFFIHKYVCLNFDDGYYAVYKNAYPLLKNNRFKFTLALIGAYLKDKKIKNNNDYRYLTIKEIKEMVDSLDIEIASHSLTHRDLRKLSEKELEKEIKESKELLEEFFKKEVLTFVYPYGRYDSRVIKNLIKNGYLLGRSTNYGKIDFFLKRWELGVKEVRKETPLTDIISYINKNQYTILLFHRITEKPRYFTDYSKKDFSFLIDYLKENNIKVVSLKEMYEIWWQDFLERLEKKEETFKKIYAPIYLDILKIK